MRLLDGAYWSRALRNPVVLAGLAVDLAPIYAVAAWGWGAGPLVMVYWIENLIAGAMTLPRIFLSGARFGVGGVVAGAGLSAFFTLHYGLFCLVHGTFLIMFLSFTEPGMTMPADAMMNVGAMVRLGLASAPHVGAIVGLIALFQLVVLVWEFLIKGEWKRSNPMEEMMAPYGRIVVLHIAIFAGAGALIVLGQPMVGVLGLIVLRAVWGVIQNETRSRPPEPDPEREKATRALEALLSGKKPEES
jgi:hypothetical protein